MDITHAKVKQKLVTNQAFIYNALRIPIIPRRFGWKKFIINNLRIIFRAVIVSDGMANEGLIKVKGLQSETYQARWLRHKLDFHPVLPPE